EPFLIYELIVAVGEGASTATVTSIVTSSSAVPVGESVAVELISVGSSATVGDARAVVVTVGEGDAVSAPGSSVVSDAGIRVSEGSGVPVSLVAAEGCASSVASGSALGST